ncbi:hypothetical protein CGC56_10110 [Capnocytophaga canimorsus]|uniref:Uncharacterized protein n=1 Tax=Capnocytophaga canimorsus TaxID=28188 RepID=A0A250G5J8_9FLAO|nr:hypothetical protein CGC56_10110 [Capnocytophaga canimorsus]
MENQLQDKEVVISNLKEQLETIESEIEEKDRVIEIYEKEIEYHKSKVEFTSNLFETYKTGTGCCVSGKTYLTGEYYVCGAENIFEFYQKLIQRYEKICFDRR